MPKINREEYEMLKGLDERWKWIARDKNNTLVMGAGKNERYLDGWFPPVNVGDSLVVDETNAVKDVSEYGNLFQFIQWEDDEPYNIQELIEEYLYNNQPKLFIDGQEQSFEFIEESEEKEVKKDIEWAKKEIKKIHTLTFDAYEAAVMANNKHFQMKNSEQLALINKILEILKQLDEPEVLSQEWIDEHKETIFDLDEDFETEFIKADDLQNLLVPKESLGNSQELEKVQIPQFVADYIEEGHELVVDLGTALTIETDHLNDIKKYIRDNEETFARAWLAYPNVEVEKEQKYYAKIKGHENIYSGICFWIYDTEIEELLIDNAEIYPDVTAEYMIKATKEEWANLGINDDNADFVKVEELEE